MPETASLPRACDRRRKVRAKVALTLAALAMPARGVTLAPDSPSDLGPLREQLAALEAELGRVRRDASSAEETLAVTRLERRIQETRLAEAVAERALARQAVADAEGRVGELEGRLVDSWNGLRGSLVGLYRLGREGPLRLLFSVRSREHLLFGMRMLRYLTLRNALAMERHLDVGVTLSLERDELVARRREADAWVEREARRRAELTLAERRHESQLRRLREEGRGLAHRTLDLAAREARLARLFDSLEGGSPPVLGGQRLEDFRGALAWPADGDVLAGFGPRSDPRYGTRVPHNGLDIAIAPGAQVRSVFPGEVLFAGALEGYGHTVVVRHEGAALTLYAGLAELRVTRGAVVSLGQSLGAGGQRLYFEIRLDNKPEDPVHWLRPSSRP